MKRLVAVLNTLAAVIVAAGVDVIFPSKFTNVEQYFLGLLIFIALTLVEMLFAFHEIGSKVDIAVTHRKAEDHAWRARTELDRKLQEVQALFHQLDVEADNQIDLFHEYHKKRLTDLERSLRDACVKQQTQIDETMFSVTSWLLGSSFHARDQDILRAVLPTKDLDFFFDVHTKMYFQQMWDLVQKGAATGVQRLIIVDSVDHLRDPRLLRLIAFHNTQDRYDCRLLTRSQFDRIVLDYRLQHLLVDFGIYGNTYLYKGLMNQDEHIIGIYSKDPVEIADFISCFASCWEAGRELPTTDTPPENAAWRIEWLFADYDIATASTERKKELHPLSRDEAPPSAGTVSVQENHG